MYIYKNDGIPTQDLPSVIRYVLPNGKEASVAPPYTREQLQLAGYEIADDPPQVTEDYVLEWINKSWVVRHNTLYDNPNPVPYLDDEDPITREIKT